MPIRLSGEEGDGEEAGWWEWVEAARPDFRYWRQLLLSSSSSYSSPYLSEGEGEEEGEGVLLSSSSSSYSSLSEGEGVRRRGRRRLLDTFGQSLIHVNRLYHQVREG